MSTTPQSGRATAAISTHCVYEEEQQVDLATAIEQFFGDVQAAAQVIAPRSLSSASSGLG